MYSKHQKYLKYLFTIYQNFQTKPIYMLNLNILIYVIEIYMRFIILFIDFENF